MLNFDMVVFEEVDDSDLDDWEYVPYDPNDQDRILVRTERTDVFRGHKFYFDQKDTFKLLR